MDELLDLILELPTLFSVMTMVSVVEAISVRVSSIILGLHFPGFRYLPLNLHQDLHVGHIQGVYLSNIRGTLIPRWSGPRYRWPIGGVSL